MHTRLEFADFGSRRTVGRRLLDGTRGAFELLLTTLRRWRATRLAFATGPPVSAPPVSAIDNRWPRIYK
jgi:hypothetical protein